MSKLGTISTSGQSGKPYSFNVLSLDSNFDEIPAVYVVTNRHKSGDRYSHTFIYIGQTDNLKERIENHHKQDCFDKNDANAICVHQEYSEKKRLTIESNLIEAKNPLCND